MRWIRYEANGQPVYGIVEGDMVNEVRGEPFFGYEKTATRRPLSAVKLMVPWIETEFDLNAAQTIIRVNGGERFRFKTNSMIFGPATFISRMTQYLTLYPGDVVWMGTEGAPENLKHGDTVEIEITGIG